MKRLVLFPCVLGLVCLASVSPAQSPRLIGWWTMDEEPGATTLTDASGYGRPCTLGTGTSIVDGRFGKAVYFDGTTNAWARFLSNTHLTNLTISLWFNVPPSYTNSTYPKLVNFNTLYYQFSASLPQRFNIGLGSTPTRAEWTTPDQIPFKFTTNQWHHAALVVQRAYTNETEWVAQPVFYLNGIRCGSDVQTPKTYLPDNIGANYAFLGNTSIGGMRPLDGALDEVRIYNDALSDHEILALYNNRPPMADAGADQVIHRGVTRLPGRIVSTIDFSRRIAATSLWSVVSAPAGATPVIEHPDLPETAVSLPEAGTYVFRLTSFSELGNSSDEVTIECLNQASIGNTAPSVTALWPATNTVFGASVPIAATVTDDGHPGPVRLCWSKVSGPGAVFFDNAFTNETAASFSAAGTYVVRLTADDGDLSGHDVITVTVAAPVGDLTEGLIHWWPMDDEPTTKKATDRVGDMTLSLSFSALLQPGKTGLGFRAPRLDAVGIGSTFPVLSSNMTFAFWFYHDGAYIDPAGSGNLYQRVIHVGPNFYIIYKPGNRTFDLSTRGIGTGSDQHTWMWPNDIITPNRWFHAAFLFNSGAAAGGSRQVMYLNGVKIPSNPLNTPFPGAVDFVSPFFVGNNSTQNGTRNFDGVIDDLRIYSRFLQDEEILRLAADPNNNHAPVIEAPTTVKVKAGQPFANIATVTDDGHPYGGSLATRWSVIAGDPAAVWIEDTNNPASAMLISRSGLYTLRLYADDGERRSAVNLTLTATPTGTLFTLQ